MAKKVSHNKPTKLTGMLRANEPVIDDDNYSAYVQDPEVDGERKSRGLIPRDYNLFPQGCYASAPSWSVNMPLIPRSEWSDRIKGLIDAQAQLSDIRLRGNKGNPIPSTDQNGRGYCWIHSGTSAVLVNRAVMNEEYVALSAYAGACIIKNYRDEGGWGAQGLDFLMARGLPSEEFWPQRSVSRTHDNPATWENAAKHKVTEGFIDLAVAQYDRNLTFDQVATCLLSGVPVIGDFNWWGHSVCLLDLLDMDPSLDLMNINRWAIRLWNSWADSWGDRGMGVIKGRKCVPDGATAPRATLPSLV